MNLKTFNIVQPQEQPTEEVNSAVKMANISIRVDANCFLLCDGEFTEIELQAGKITKVQLPVGQHLLEFIDSEYPELKMEKEVDWPDEGKSYLVLVDEFKKVVDALKAKEEAERNKPIKYEVEDCIYELYPATYTATLIKSTAKKTVNKIVVLKTISYLDNDYSITAIGERVFEDFSSLTSIDIPDSVMSIGKYAFYKCESLTSITIPNSVTSIGEEAFCGCSSLTSIVIGNGVKSIGNWAFCACSSLTSVVIGNSVTSIGDNAFKACSSLTRMVIPEGVTSIGEGAFKSCGKLTSITIPNSVTSIGYNAFDRCSSLPHIIIPNRVKSIGNRAFIWCRKLEVIKFQGTKEQWMRIEKGRQWNGCDKHDRIPTKVIYCTNGDVKI